MGCVSPDRPTSAAAEQGALNWQCSARRALQQLALNACARSLSMHAAHGPFTAGLRGDRGPEDLRSGGWAAVEGCAVACAAAARTIMLCGWVQGLSFAASYHLLYRKNRKIGLKKAAHLYCSFQVMEEMQFRLVKPNAHTHHLLVERWAALIMCPFYGSVVAVHGWGGLAWIVSALGRRGARVLSQPAPHYS